MSKSKCLIPGGCRNVKLFMTVLEKENEIEIKVS